MGLIDVWSWALITGSSVRRYYLTSGRTKRIDNGIIKSVFPEWCRGWEHSSGPCVSAALVVLGGRRVPSGTV